MILHIHGAEYMIFYDKSNEFFCHAQIVTELNRYNADAPIWLSEKIGAQKIKSYTDQEILESLSLVRGPLACATYTQMLKLACDCVE